MLLYDVYRFLFFMQEGIPDGIVDKFLEVSPFNAAAYGLLTLVGYIWAYMERKDRKEKESNFLNIVEKSIAVLAIVENQVPIFGKIESSLDRNHQTISNLASEIRDLSRKS